MTREEIRSKIFELLKQQVMFIQANPNQTQQLQLGAIYKLFEATSEPQWQNQKVLAVAREIIQELENAGFIYEGQAGGTSSMSSYPWYTITGYGIEALLKDDWLPYDPEGYLKALKAKVPDIDDITLTYMGEAIAAYNGHYLLSATITLGVASENLMLLLIEVYTNWISNPKRKESFQKKTAFRFISTQYKEFKKEFVADLVSLPREFQADWEIYLDGIFNFIRLNRNEAGHPTGKEFDVKVVYASLQTFAEYAQFIYKLIRYFKT